MNMRLLARAAVPFGFVLLLLTACAPTPPPELKPREVPPLLVIDPAKPCTRAAPAGAAPSGAKGGAARATYDRATNTISVTGGSGVDLAALSTAVGNSAALTQAAPGEWLLGANLEILSGASVEIAAPEVKWLKMSSSPAGYTALRVIGGKLTVNGTCITSWDTTKKQIDDNYLDGRSFLLARDGGQMTIDHAELSYLGHAETESYGLAWRLKGSGGGITNSIIDHLYFGMYSFQVDGLTVSDNEVFSSVVYGIDPHTGSTNLKIQRNIVHDNGKHGIILAEDCTNSVITDNVVYRNQHHGIVLYLRSDGNRVENNETFNNLAQGVNINEASKNIVQNNKIYNNTESGIGIGQNADDNLVANNDIRGNEQDGIRLVSATTNARIQDNIIGENTRYGIYIDGQGPFQMNGNQIFGSRAGVALNGTSPLPPGTNKIYGNSDMDVKSLT